MPGAEIAYVALGSNLGDRVRHLSEARRLIEELPGCRIVARSEVEETEPIVLDGEEQGRYLNQMIAVETTLNPQEFLACLQKIEIHEGRERERRWGPRTLDLDIVLFGSLDIDTPTLKVPHPELRNRDFWQRELEQVRSAR
jgi:2-amino-4-hydroxy-6-hydroxymethyldihydropteridine diphosphokinase